MIVYITTLKSKSFVELINFDTFGPTFVFDI